MADLRDATELAWTARDPAFLAAFGATRLLPSVKGRVALRAAILGALAGRDATQRRAIAILRRNWAANRGAQILAPNPVAWSVAEFPDAGGKRPQDWSCNPVNRAYIGKFFRLAARHRIEVYWLLNPIHPSNQSRRDRLEVDRPMDPVRPVGPRPPNVVVVNARRIGLDATHFVDSGHPDRRGRPP